METLSERFSALQDKLMDIYESGHDDLETQIVHWQLLRQEQVLLYFARRHGVMRLGYQPVPTLATSESKAKDAIGMVILLQSLQKSKYGDEPWTLVETSLETVRSPPANCFKKGPQNIEVWFDGDPENIMLYTVWSFIYYQTINDTWEKVEGHVDYYGAYYLEGTFKTYYIEFQADAARYSRTGEWEVHVNKDTVFAPVTSSTSSAGDGAVPDTSVDSVSNQPAAQQPSPTNSTERPSSRTESRRYRRKVSSPKRSTRRQRQEISRRSRSRSQGRQQSSRGGKRRRRARSSSRDTTYSTDSGGGRSRRASTRSQSRSHSRTKSRSRSRPRGSAATSGIDAADVGKSLQSVGRKHLGRVERLLAEANDPPVVLLRGEANCLKCYRYRIKKKHRGLVKYISSTWSWIGGENTDRVGRSRMLIAFFTDSDRELFLKSMKLPPKVDWSLGNFDDL